MATSIHAESGATVHIPLSDELMLSGEYRSPDKPSTPFLVMLHGLGSNHNEWTSLAEAAARHGWGSIGIDLRGHGGSQIKDLVTVDYKDPRYGQDPLFWQGMIKDLTETAQWLEKEMYIKQSRMILVGASVGANICLNAAVKLKEVPAVVLLSPGYNYAGITTVPVMKDWRKPILLVASKPDAYASQSVKRLQEESRAPDKLAAWISDKPGPQGPHGAQMFDGKLEEKILDWINRSVRQNQPAD